MKCIFHKWEGCVCIKCGTQRDANHRWEGCKCLQCGKTRDIGHIIKGGRCDICGAIFTEDQPPKEKTSAQRLADSGISTGDYYRRLARELATTDRSTSTVIHIKALEQKLLDGEDEAAAAIYSFIFSCGLGEEESPWWHYISRLVGILYKMPGGLHYLERIPEINSPIDEFQINVIDTARGLLANEDTDINKAPEKTEVSGIIEVLKCNGQKSIDTKDKTAPKK